MSAKGTYEGWAPWHPAHGFQDQFMSATWVSTDLDEIAQRVKRLNQDDKTNNRTGWRAVKITLALSSTDRVGGISLADPEPPTTTFTSTHPGTPR